MREGSSKDTERDPRRRQEALVKLEQASQLDAATETKGERAGACF